MFWVCYSSAFWALPWLITSQEKYRIRELRKTKFIYSVVNSAFYFCPHLIVGVVDGQWYLMETVFFHLCLWSVIINPILFYWYEIPNLYDHKASRYIPLFATLPGEEGGMAGCCPTSNGKRCLHFPLWKLTSCTSILTFLHNHTFHLFLATSIVIGWQKTLLS